MSAADLTPEALAKRLGLPRPTEEQAEVIGYPLRPLLVVAGAGSGKTATMSQRVVHLVATGVVRPDQVLGLTFTRKATAELAERVSLRLAQLADSGVIAGADEDPEPTVATYDSFAGSLVREYGLYVGADPDATLITEARKWQIVTDIIERRTDPLPFDSKSGAIGAVLRADNALSTNLLSIDTAREELSGLHEQLVGLVSTYGVGSDFRGAPEAMEAWLGALDAVQDFRDYKRRHGLVDFGDRLALACRIAEEVPEAAAAMRAQYPAVLLDEFQDTSVAQVRLLSALFADQGVTAVGDPNQAIYGWRGASAGALDTFHARFNPTGVQAVARGGNPEAETPVLQLSTAWRNDSTVLVAANVISRPLRNPEYQPGDALVSHVPVRELQERSAADGLGAGQVLATFLADPLQEADAIADFMQERWRPDAELAVLCRSRSQMTPVAEALEARGVPYEVAVSGGMLSIPEVADVRALLTVAADPERGDRLMRLLAGATLVPLIYGLCNALPVSLHASTTWPTASGRGRGPTAPILRKVAAHPLRSSPRRRPFPRRSRNSLVVTMPPAPPAPACRGNGRADGGSCGGGPQRGGPADCAADRPSPAARARRTRAAIAGSDGRVRAGPGPGRGARRPRRQPYGQARPGHVPDRR
ncbi:ATP-dependent helicase [Actinomyces ruminis]|uniref:ATP-dependent helicase n=1 Tax=Actinomyces ruminis TaxID=1937003 RepID=UPI00211EF1F9|nr:ATP-dependent helicase [Actinomyces ruminis]